MSTENSINDKIVELKEFMDKSMIAIEDIDDIINSSSDEDDDEFYDYSNTKQIDDPPLIFSKMLKRLETYLNYELIENSNGAHYSNCELSKLDILRNTRMCKCIALHLDWLKVSTLMRFIEHQNSE